MLLMPGYSTFHSVDALFLFGIPVRASRLSTKFEIGFINIKTIYARLSFAFPCTCGIYIMALCFVLFFILLLAFQAVWDRPSNTC